MTDQEKVPEAAALDVIAEEKAQKALERKAKNAAAREALLEDMDEVERMLVAGDISKIAVSSELRTRFIAMRHYRLGIPYTPGAIIFITTDGKVIPYDTAVCASAIRAVKGWTSKIISQEVVANGAVYTVTMRVYDPKNQEHFADNMGALPLMDSGGQALAPSEIASNMKKTLCVPLDSEILTRRGFRRYDQVQVGEDVLAYSLEDDACHWTPLQAVNVFKTSPVGTLRTRGGKFAVRCTAEHSWATRGFGKKRELIQTSQLHSTHNLILAAPEHSKDSLLSPAEAAILGWAISDGTLAFKLDSRYPHLKAAPRIVISQSKEEHFAAIDEAVAAVGGRGRTQAHAAGFRTFPGGKTYATRAAYVWCVPSAVSRSIVSKTGYAGVEDLPRIVTHLDTRARAAMLQAFMWGDGSKRGVFYNSDPLVFETVQILATLQGVALGVLRSQGPAEYRPNFRQRLRKLRTVACNNVVFESGPEEPVWCPTTRFGTWVMRQGGYVTITGNTQAERRATFSLAGIAGADPREDGGPMVWYPEQSLQELKVIEPKARLVSAAKLNETVTATVPQAVAEGIVAAQDASALLMAQSAPTEAPKKRRVVKRKDGTVVPQPQPQGVEPAEPSTRMPIPAPQSKETPAPAHVAPVAGVEGPAAEPVAQEAPQEAPCAHPGMVRWLASAPRGKTHPCPDCEEVLVAPGPPAQPVLVSEGMVLGSNTCLHPALKNGKPGRVYCCPPPPEGCGQEVRIPGEPEPIKVATTPMPVRPRAVRIVKRVTPR